MANSEPGQTPSKAALDFFRETWTQHLVIALRSILGEHVDLGDSGEPVQPVDQWFHQTFPPLEGALSVGLDRASLVSICADLLEGASVKEDTENRAVQVFAEMLSHASAAMASQFSARLKSEVRVATLRRSDQPPPSDGTVFHLQLITDAASYPVSAVVVGRDLIKLFNPNQGAVRVCAAPSGSPGDSLGVSTRNLDLLLDVELPISVSFGRAQLPLKDVIKLTTGSIVELNRSVTEPVDIVVNNCIIARGEVVVVEGNFGVRIKQIVSKEERLRSIK